MTARARTGETELRDGSLCYEDATGRVDSGDNEHRGWATHGDCMTLRAGDICQRHDIA